MQWNKIEENIFYLATGMVKYLLYSMGMIMKKAGSWEHVWK